MLLHVVVAPGEQISLDGKAEAPALAHRGPVEAPGEFHLAAIGGHGEGTGQLQAGGALASCEGFAHDLALYAAPGGGEDLRAVGRADEHDALHPAP